MNLQRLALATCTVLVLVACNSSERDNAAAPVEEQADAPGTADSVTIEQGDDPHAQHRAAPVVTDAPHTGHTAPVAPQPAFHAHAQHGLSARPAQDIHGAHTGPATRTVDPGASRSAGAHTQHAAGASGVRAADTHREHTPASTSQRQGAASHEAHGARAMPERAEVHAAHRPNASAPEIPVDTMKAMATLLELMRALTADAAVRAHIEADAVLRALWSDPGVRQRIQSVPRSPPQR